MISSAKIYLTDCVDPHRNLAMEDAMLQSLPEGQAVLFLWQNRHTVVVGAGQNAWRECDTALLEKEGGVLARRSSGGGAVYHDLGNLNFSFLLPREDYDLERQLRVVTRAVEAHGVQIEASGRNDLTVGGRKFSGNAFRFLGHSALHHGTLLIHSDMNLVRRYLTPDREKLEAKGVKSVPARVVNLGEVCGATVESMRKGMMEAFSGEYGGAEIRAAREEDFPLFEKLFERYGSWQWNYGASPLGCVALSARFDWGGVEICARVEKGEARQVHVFTDSMDETLADRLKEALVGCPWRGEELARRAEEAGETDVARWLARSAG